MPKTLIQANPGFQKSIDPDDVNLFISEMFSDTIQGENFMGVPATFLRVMNCTLNCTWCDSVSVWRFGNPYGITEILDMWEREGVVERFRQGQHLILTGGSPLKQQRELVMLIERFIERFGFKPIIQIENECVLPPSEKMKSYINIWNNSPKLESSGNTRRAQYKPEVIKQTAQLLDSYFKFVVVDEEDWNEIKRDYLDTELIRRDQIVLMPQGQTREELELTRNLTIEIAIRETVRYSDRLHVVAWDKKTGV